MSFQAEVGRILDLMVHSVYSEKEVFLRELISNAADACDKLRYLALTEPHMMADGGDFAITVTVDKAQRRLTVSDNGIGMSRDEMVENLGTIARSGTAAFSDALTGDKSKDVSLIGQFGVGFYSAFMVAGEVEVVSRRAGDEEAWAWRSDGRGDFTISPAERAMRGTDVVLMLREGEDEFLEEARLRHIVRTYSDHIPVPVQLLMVEAEDKSAEAETINSASALWSRPKSEITPEQYTEFYRHVGHGFDEPWATVHFRAEGMREYNALLFIPSMRPFDLFQPERRAGVKLYVRRVFITDHCDEVVPGWLRFLRGVVDSEDLPLNISREMLQNNPVLRQIKSGVVRRVLDELKQRAEADAESYATFWGNFGAVLKEGLYEAAEHRETLLKLARFRSTKSGEALISLDEYIGRMRPGQDAIYFISGDDGAALLNSPQIEGFTARGIEVLLLDEPIDEFWPTAVTSYQDKALKSATRGDIDLSATPLENEEEAPADETGKAEDVVSFLKTTLGGEVRDVRVSSRLTSSPVCLVAGEGDMDLHLQKLMKMHGQGQAAAPRILEINPRHPLVRALGDNLQHERAADLAFLLLDQARVLEGESLPDPAAFARRMSDALQASLGGRAA